jgi:hypothetical protein
VRERRPDVPPRVDAIVRRALAKAPRERFASMSDLIAELEAARLGEPARDDSEVTMIVPPAVAPRPGRGRNALRTLVLSLIAVLLVAGAAIGAYVLTRGVESSVSGDGGEKPAAIVRLTGAGAYDPSGDFAEHDDEAPNAVDGDAGTYWKTETYRDGLAKDGVGLLLDARAAKAVSSLRVVTDTPGFTAEIKDGNSQAGPFETVSAPRTVSATTTFTLRNANARYYVVWITDLGGGNVAHVNEVRARG